MAAVRLPPMPFAYTRAAVDLLTLLCLLDSPSSPFPSQKTCAV